MRPLGTLIEKHVRLVTVDGQQGNDTDQAKSVLGRLMIGLEAHYGDMAGSSEELPT